jgi:hypothetical protein
MVTEGFGEYSIRPQLLRQFQVNLLPAGSQARNGEDRHAPIFRPQCLDRFQPFLFRHHEVHDHQIRGRAAIGAHAGAAIRCLLDGVSVRLQARSHHFTHRFIVIHDQDSERLLFRDIHHRPH